MTTTYYTVLTEYGQAKVAAALVSGIPINLTQMSVGDGNGSPVTPDPAMTALVHEVYRTNVNNIIQDPDHANVVYVEMLIDTAHGGWTIREFGVWDDHNQLVGVGNFPATYKTTADDGATNDLAIQAALIVGDTSVVNLVLDPAMITATHAWALATITPALLLPGGTTGQVLTKASNTDGDTEWASPSTANVTVNVIQEDQTAAGSQATFTLATATTDSLAVYKNGIRIPYRTGAGGWQKGTPALTKVVLGTACAGGEEMLFIQNEPAGFLVTPLDATLNLTDLTNAGVARTALDVYNKAETDQMAPPGKFAYFAMPTAPTGWLKCNGAVVSRTVYSRLWNAIGTTWGVGDGVTTFGLPDMRGEFVRGWDDGRGIDTGRLFASFEDWSTAAPKTTTPSRQTSTGTTGLVAATNPSKLGFMRASKSGESVTPGGGDATGSGSEPDIFNVATGDAETRPRNVSMLACIKY